MRERLKALVTTAVELAIVRHDLQNDAPEDITEDDRAAIAIDTWDAMNGIGTCNEEVMPELAACLDDDSDSPVCRLQFPDGSVPANAREAAEGWKVCYDECQDFVSRTLEMLKAERAEWCAMFGVKHPPGKPLSPKDVRLMKAIFAPGRELAP